MPLLQNLRQLRLDLQKLGLNLQTGERACCRNTDGERLRHALAAADGTLAKQVHVYSRIEFSLEPGWYFVAQHLGN